jgi:hypothetical protein
MFVKTEDLNVSHMPCVRYVCKLASFSDNLKYLIILYPYVSALSKEYDDMHMHLYM